MPPRPIHRLNLYAVLSGWPSERALAALEAAGVVAGRGPGPQAADVLPGGFTSWRSDRPARPILYANRQGGFRARCPRCAEPVAEPLGRALASWRAGGPRGVVCPRCLWSGDADQVSAAPPIAFGGGAVVFVDVAEAALAAGARARLAHALGEAPAFVWSRE